MNFGAAGLLANSLIGIGKRGVRFVGGESRLGFFERNNIVSNALQEETGRNQHDCRDRKDNLLKAARLVGAFEAASDDGAEDESGDEASDVSAIIDTGLEVAIGEN